MLRVFLNSAHLQQTRGTEPITKCDCSTACCTVLYCTAHTVYVQYSTVQYCTVQYSTLQYSTVQQAVPSTALEVCLSTA